MRRLCTIYDKLVGKRTFFFERYDHKPYNHQWVSNNFHLCWKWGGLENHRMPRPYDLRHAFATRNLMRWVDEGQNIMVLLPFLSTYMGHSEFDSTLYYIHLLPERIRKSAGIDWRLLSSIYTEGGDDIDD